MAYPADRRYQPMAGSGCRVFEVCGDLVLTDCDSYPGSSGGPMQTTTETGPALAAVMVAVVPGRASIAIQVQAWPDLPLGGACL